MYGTFQPGTVEMFRASRNLTRGYTGQYSLLWNCNGPINCNSLKLMSYMIFDKMAIADRDLIAKNDRRSLVL